MVFGLVGFASATAWRSVLSNKDALWENESQPSITHQFYHYTIEIFRLPGEADAHEVPDPAARLILWELFENNFRLELKALEESFRTSKGDVSPEEIMERDLLLSGCFPREHSCVIAELPDPEEGLGGKVWSRRLPFTVSLAKLEQYWPCPNHALVKPTIASKLDEMTESDFKRFEETTVCFYLESFFIEHLRAPTVPHIRPA